MIMSHKRLDAVVLHSPLFISRHGMQFSHTHPVVPWSTSPGRASFRDNFRDSRQSPFISHPLDTLYTCSAPASKQLKAPLHPLRPEVHITLGPGPTEA